MFVGFVFSLITGLNSNLLNILGTISSLLAGLATVATTVIAYKAYSNWRLQVSSPNSYESDVVLVTKLKNIQERCFAFSDMYGAQIFYIFSTYRQLTLDDELEKEYVDSTNTELNGELESVRQAAKEGMSLNFLTEFGDHVLHRSNHVFKSNTAPIQELLNYQIALKAYINAISIITRRKLISGTIQYYPDIDGRSNVTFMSIGLDGDLYLNLQHSYNKVLEHYQHKWEV